MRDGVTYAVYFYTNINLCTKYDILLFMGVEYI